MEFHDWLLVWVGVLCTGFGFLLGVLYGRREECEIQNILPPRGGSVMSRPTVGPKGGTPVPPKGWRPLYPPPRGSP
jgi:hypothetical protein